MFARLVTWAGRLRCCVVPSPICPDAFAPHVQTVPSLLRATENARPAAMAVTEDKPVTGANVERGVVVLSPSCPLALRPQADTDPSDRNASVCEPPAATAITPVTPLTTAAVECPVDASPSCLYPFVP